MTILTETTETVLLSAKLAEGTTSFNVPDDSGCFNPEQLDIFHEAKYAFGCEAAKTTFKIVVKNGERSIYEPSVMNKDGVVCVQWGELFVPVGLTAEFDGYTGLLTAEYYSLKVRVLNIKPEEAKTDTQKAYSKLAKDARGSFLNKAWKNGTIIELLAEGFPNVKKLSEVAVGVHSVVEYKMGGFDKYILKLADGTWLRANTSLQNKLADYDEMEVIVSKDQPAKLTVEVSTAVTSKGYPIIPVRLTSYKNSNIPQFDFSLV